MTDAQSVSVQALASFDALRVVKCLLQYSVHQQPAVLRNS
jgi:hypothetical protein